MRFSAGWATPKPMYFIAAACAVNIGLDYLFMGAWAMGPLGAALGTTLAQDGERDFGFSSNSETQDRDKNKCGGF